MSDATVIPIAGGAILCDPSLAAQVEARWFDPLYWSGSPSGQVSGGRGAAWMVETPAGAGVLRHYRRGGAMARLLGDRYWWRGAVHTRPWREFQLLQDLYGQGLPVPQALAAHYRRHGLFYRADLLTRRLPQALTLAELLRAGQLDAPLMRQAGHTIARFHRAGAWHADLNAHNILRSGGEFYLIDFDRGELRPAAAGWQLQNLARLRRSLLKLGAAAAGSEAQFDAKLWQPLQQAHAAALENGHTEAAAAAAEKTRP
jgi:3-deoxy-D-manno-octulosonic acid kinase